jgi:hypothetical protein
MRYLFFILFLVAFCFAGTHTRQGDRNVAYMQSVYFDPGSSDTDSGTTVLLYNSNIYVDSGGVWKQINGTADSCSYPFYLTDPSGNLYPQTVKSIMVTSTSIRDDSNAVQFNIESRERYWDLAFGWTWDTWVKSLHEQSDGNVIILDTLKTVDSDSAIATRHKLNFSRTGVQARICPKIPGGTATDSVQFSNFRYLGR